MKPPLRVTVTTEVALAPPAVIASEVGLKVKDAPCAAPPATVTVTVVVAVATPVPDPWITSGYGPFTAPVAACTVSVDVAAVTLVGLTVAVTPAGAPVTVNATGPVKGAVRDTVITDVTAAPPTFAVTAPGSAASPIAPFVAATTTTVSVAVAVVTPVPAALIVMVLLPGVTAAPTEISTVAVVAAPGMTSGEKVTVTPVGLPLADRVTAPVKEPLRVMVAATVLLPPCATLTLVGESASETEPAGGFSSLLQAEIVMIPVTIVRVAKRRVRRRLSLIPGHRSGPPVRHYSRREPVMRDRLIGPPVHTAIRAGRVRKSPGDASGVKGSSRS